MRFLLTSSPFISRRIDRVLFATQFVGGIVGLIIGHAQFWFVDFWLGVALASPLGVALGTTWELHTEREGDADSGSGIAWPRVFKAAVISILFAGVGVFVLIPKFTTAKANVRILRTLPQDSLTRIDVYKPFSTKPVAVIDDENAVSEFILASRDVRLNHFARIENEQNLGKWWLVLRLHDGRNLGFEWSESSPTEMYGMFIKTTPNSMTNRGEFASATLRDWFRRHLETRLTHRTAQQELRPPGGAGR